MTQPGPKHAYAHRRAPARLASDATKITRMSLIVRSLRSWPKGPYQFALYSLSFSLPRVKWFAFFSIAYGHVGNELFWGSFSK